MLHRNRKIGQLFGGDFRALGDQLLANHIFRGGIDRFHRRDNAITQMEHGEFARAGIAARHDAIAGPRQARDLQLEVELVGQNQGTSL